MMGWIGSGKHVIGVSASTGVELQSTATAVIVANTLGFLSNYKNYSALPLMNWVLSPHIASVQL